MNSTETKQCKKCKEQINKKAKKWKLIPIFVGQ